MVTNNFALTLQQVWKDYQETDIRVVQNDVSVNILTIEVYNGSTEVDYSELSSGTITFVKDDNNIVQGDLTINAGNITYTMGTNEIAIPGVVRASIQLFGAAGERLTPARFRFYVDADLISAAVVESTTEFPILQALKTELEAIDVVELTNDFDAHLADSVAHEDALNLVKRTVTSVIYYVNDTTGDNTNNGTSVGTPLKTIMTAVNKIPTDTDAPIEIRVAEGTYNEDVLIKGRIGMGSIALIGGDSVANAANYIVNQIYVSQNAGIQILVTGFTATKTTDRAIVFGYNGCYCELANCRVTAASDTYAGIGNLYTPYLLFIGCLISNRISAFQSFGGVTYSHDHDAGGSGNTYGLVAGKGTTIIKGTNQSLQGEDLCTDGGIIYDQTSRHMWLQFEHNSATAELQEITGFLTKPTMIKVTAWIDGTRMESHGVWQPSVSKAMKTANDSGLKYDAGAYTITMMANASDATMGLIQDVTTTTLNINWTKLGAGATGTCKFIMEFWF
jgi:hypothetical protein